MHSLIPRHAPAAVTAAALAFATLAAPATAAPTKVPRGPSGTAFYTPPSPLPGKRHGDLIRARGLTGKAVPPGGAKTLLLLYRSTGVDGKATAVSGTLSLPTGKAPKGGWPLVTYAHGTTGIADQCAPSRDDQTAQGPLTSYAFPLITRWLKAGWAVARTDYEGLGTPGDHPYLIGRSEGRSVLDIARAAMQADGRVNRQRTAIAGHSQGGHAALWAASLAPKYTPDVKVKGTVAFAPASHLGEQAALTSAITQPSILTALAAMVIRGLDVERPELRVADTLSDRARALYPQTLDRCLLALAGQDSFGGMAPADLFRQDVDPAPGIAALNANDPQTLTIRTPLRIEQGDVDTTVFPNFTNQLVNNLQQRRAKITYAVRKGVDHTAIVTDGAAASTRWMRARLRR